MDDKLKHVSESLIDAEGTWKSGIPQPGDGVFESIFGTAEVRKPKGAMLQPYQKEIVDSLANLDLAKIEMRLLALRPTSLDEKKKRETK